MSFTSHSSLLSPKASWKKRGMYITVFFAFLICSACGHEPASGLNELVFLQPKKVDTVIVEFISTLTPAPGKRFALSRADYPQQVEDLLDMISRKKEDYFPLEDAYAIPRLSLTFLDKEHVYLALSMSVLYRYDSDQSGLFCSQERRAAAGCGNAARISRAAQEHWGRYNLREQTVERRINPVSQSKNLI